MDAGEARGRPTTGGGGLVAGGRGRGRGGGSLEAPRIRPEVLAAHRERRVRLAAYFLAASLLFGATMFYFFLNENLTQGTGLADFDGRVLELGADAPVAGALVELVRLKSNTTSNTTTDAGGNFSFTGILAGRNELRITKEGFKETTATVFVISKAAAGGHAGPRQSFTVTRGVGEDLQDPAFVHDAIANTCLSVLALSNVLTAVGMLAAYNRRRYGHAILGGVGAFFSIGWFVGSVLGVIAIILVRGARAEFEDQRPFFAPSNIPPLKISEEVEEEGSKEEKEEEEEGEEGETPEAPAAAGAPPKAGAP